MALCMADDVPLGAFHVDIRRDDLFSQLHPKHPESRYDSPHLAFSTKSCAHKPTHIHKSQTPQGSAICYGQIEVN